MASVLCLQAYLRNQLTQQATKYLMKTFRSVWTDRGQKSNGSPTVEYIQHYLVPLFLIGVDFSYHASILAG